MRYRLNVFRKYTLPSVLSQTRKDFRWLIFFDRERSKPFEAELESIFSENENIEKIYVDDLSQVPQAVNSILDPATRMLISSRIDSDDILHSEFIQDVKGVAASAQKKGIVGGYAVDFPRTLMLDASTHRIFLKEFTYVTQYGSLVEAGEPGNFLTSLHFDHTTIGEHFPVHTVDNLRTMTVVHDMNWISRLPDQSWRAKVGQIWRGGIRRGSGPWRLRLSGAGLAKFSLSQATAERGETGANGSPHCGQ